MKVYIGYIFLNFIGWFALEGLYPSAKELGLHDLAWAYLICGWMLIIAVDYLAIKRIVNYFRGDDYEI